MKRYVIPVLMLLLCAMLSGCAASSANDGAANVSATEAPVAVDVDLTKMSTTMMYGQLNTILSEPDEYLGKRIRISGNYYSAMDPNTNQPYFLVLFYDPTGCCQQGFEFVLSDQYVYPDDYPQENDFITVTGTFETYAEGEYLYCRLADAIIEGE